MNPNISPHPATSRRTLTGFTLVEMMVSVVIFLAFVIAALVTVQLYGMRVYTLAATKITATADSRETLNSLRNSVRAAQVVYVGTYPSGIYPPNSTNFNRIANGSRQIGNALAIYSSSINGVPAGTPTIYYQDPNTSPTNLWEIDTNNNLIPQLNYMTNYYCFDAEDYSNNIVSVYRENPVIHMGFQFVQWEYPISMVTNSAGIDAYAYYSLQSRIARRN